MNPVLAILFYFYKIYFNIILHILFWVFQVTPSFTFCHLNCVCISVLRRICHFSSLSHSPSFGQ